MNELTILNTIPAKKREVNMLEVLEQTREVNMITIDKQKVPDETSVAALNIEATRNALKECFPVANSGYLDKPYIYNKESGIWEGVAHKAEAQADVVNYLTDQTKTLLAMLKGSTTISNKLSVNISNIANEYVNSTSTKVGAELLEMSTPELIAFKNGLYNFKTNELRPLVKEDMQTMALPYPLIEATLENEHVKYWVDFIELLTGESKELILKYIGFLFYRSQKTIQTIMIFINGQTANGRNGKGKLIEFMRLLLGEGANANYTALSIGDLADSNKDFVKVNLVNKMANFDADSDSKFLASTNTLKLLSTNDPITANVKGAKHVTFENYARMIVATNKLPNYRDSSMGFSDRLVIVPFIRFFGLNNGVKSEDVTNYLDPGKRFHDSEKAKHSHPEALGAFVYYCIQQFREMMEAGLSANPFRDLMTEEALNILNNYEYNNDPLQQFLNESELTITKDREDFILRDGLFDLFKTENSDSKLSEAGFYNELESRGVIVKEGKAQRKCRKQVNGVNVSILRGIKSERQTANEALAEKEMNNIF